jgi:outer membrane lipoprotein-sorting protein
MKKCFILFIVTVFVLVGCSQKSNNEVSEATTETNTDTNADNEIELKGTEEIGIFTKAVENVKKEPGIVNMTNPQYQFSIGEESYFLWITEDSGTIMNRKDTQTIYSLSSSSVKEVYDFVNKSKLAKTEAVQEDWDISPAFTISKPGADGKDIAYGLRGIDGKLAIVDGPVIAEANNKELFHFWGGTPEKTEQLFNKKVKVVGTSKEYGETVTAFESSIGVPNEEIIKPPHHYAESVGYLNLPSKGIWKLDAYIEDELFGSFIIDVQEK